MKHGRNTDLNDRLLWTIYKDQRGESKFIAVCDTNIQ